MRRIRSSFESRPLWEMSLRGIAGEATARRNVSKRLAGNGAASFVVGENVMIKEVVKRHWRLSLIDQTGHEHHKTAPESCLLLCVEDTRVSVALWTVDVI